MSDGLQLLNDAPYPQNDPLTLANKKGEGFLNEQQWGQWFLALQNTVNAAPVRIGNDLNLSDQNAALTAADLNAGVLAAGVYRVAYMLRCSLPGGVSSAFQVSIVWTVGGVTQTFPGAVVSGNLPTSFDTDTILIRVDANSPVTAAVSYASNPGGAATFDVDVTLERVQPTSN